ncbi:Basic leucine zipper transcriptional factor ATF-like [Plecturocebus cupreus]
MPLMDSLGHWFSHVGQAGLELQTSGDPPASASQSARITGMSHPAWPHLIFIKTLSILKSGCSRQVSSDYICKTKCRPRERLENTQHNRVGKSETGESEDLEKQNAALRKEIKQLTEELKYFTSVLNSHEPLCSVLAASTPSPPEVVYSAHAFHQPHVSSPRFQP